ncbi:MAG TPA: J domain-containing protein [Solirubrobacteraceae bacterium]|nr:J domain-containing protein [Solirubrobacteraceae bacterium]
MGVRPRPSPLRHSLPPPAVPVRPLAHRPPERAAAASLGLSALRRDPYTVLGVKPGVSDEELRAAYRRLVQQYHPDHNGGSIESARRFEEVQEAYGQIASLRRRTPVTPASPPPPTSPDVEERLAGLERELRDKARVARERAQRAAREAARATAKTKRADRPSDEELGYIKTDDSLGKILADGLDEFAHWMQQRGERGHDSGRRR